MYRFITSFFMLLTAVFALSGCGQSGALMLPSDPNYDKRSQYLLYPNVKQESAVTPESSEQPSSAK